MNTLILLHSITLQLFFFKHYTQVHAPFQLTHVVENMVNHHVGCLLQTGGTNDADLVNLCEESKTRLFQHLVQQCADQYMCHLCCDHMRDSTSYPDLCRGVQYLYRLLQHEFEVTHTRLKDCRFFLIHLTTSAI